MEVEFTESAVRDLEEIPRKQAAQILRKIERLRDGFSGDVKRLHHLDFGYRLRSGRYRVLFDLEGRKVVIQRILHRKKAYD